MKLTKYDHACVTLAKGGRTILVDPGTFTPDAPRLITEADAVLITHEHFDHFDDGIVLAAMWNRPGLRVYGPAAVTAKLAEQTPPEAAGDLGERLVTVRPGDSFELAGFAITAHGGEHALIHRDIPQVDNVGYLVDGSIYHPGDAYFVPGASVPTLLLPTSGPWTKFGEAADFVRAVRPDRVVQIHELMLSDLGQNSAAMILGENGLTGLPLHRLPAGESLDA
ncbi:MBL fold metallo-hydrolase [Paractinoplanes atraurantiacus]|uniref:L-ascorbate metabolism protein UlaG, beta-lactamase superfamily n=1 Tax=Paractinoplanes atraurantiacus TaxID=1036182 RepID=A0A285KVJ2_9ACTN|nr:MBL fold metallo-hydrolase [Actinoplanes atraurantiacus]SNY75416.1 L-ascorbate metabolism protein UlaG, beta-lactamase superfamily [Actinoplanes atraurantiacus]